MVLKVRNIKDVDCPTCGAFEGQRCSPGFRGNWSWCEKRILISDGKIPNPWDPVDHFEDLEPYDPVQEQIDEENRYRDKVASLRAMTPEDLGKEHQRQSDRHDSAVDRCEEINSPTIEDAQGWMNDIERLFKERGLDKFKYIFPEEVEVS